MIARHGDLLLRLRWASVGLRLAAAGLAVIGLGLSAAPGVLRDAVREGRTALSAGNYGVAAAAFRTAHQYQPWEPDHLAEAVQAALLDGDFDAAARDLERLAALRPLSGSEMAWWGHIYAGQGRTDDALAAWEQAWARGEVDAAGLTALARHYLAQGEPELARAALETLAASGAADGSLLYELGLLQAFDAPDSAAVTLAQAAYLSPDLTPRVAHLLAALDEGALAPADLRYTRLGVALLRAEELDLAKLALERAVGINVAYGEALAYLSYVRARLNQPALGAAEQAVALDPANPTVHYLAGLTWKHIGRPAEARQAFERAFILDPQNPAFAIEIAATHRAENSPRLAEIWLEEAERLAPADFRVRLLRAQLYVDAEYRVAEMGLPLARALVAERPDSAEAHATLGWAFFLTGDLGAAFSELDAALALDPALPRALTHKAVLLESQDRLAEARSYYTRALEADPDGVFGAFARRALERIDRP